MADARARSEQLGPARRMTSRRAGHVLRPCACISGVNCSPVPRHFWRCRRDREVRTTLPLRAQGRQWSSASNEQRKGPDRWCADIEVGGNARYIKPLPPSFPRGHGPNRMAIEITCGLTAEQDRRPRAATTTGGRPSRQAGRCGGPRGDRRSFCPVSLRPGPRGLSPATKTAPSSAWRACAPTGDGVLGGHCRISPRSNVPVWRGLARAFCVLLLLRSSDPSTLCRRAVRHRGRHGGRCRAHLLSAIAERSPPSRQSGGHGFDVIDRNTRALRFKNRTARAFRVVGGADRASSALPLRLSPQHLHGAAGSKTRFRRLPAFDECDAI